MFYAEFETRVKYLTRVHEAFQKLSELGFLAISPEDESIVGQSGCRFSLEGELRFLSGLPLVIECFSTNPNATKWVCQTLLTLLSNLGIQEVFDTYYGPDLECYAIRNDLETAVEIY